MEAWSRGEWREEEEEPRRAKHALVQDRYKRTGGKCLAPKNQKGEFCLWVTITELRMRRGEDLWVRDQLEYQYLMCEGAG